MTHADRLAAARKKANLPARELDRLAGVSPGQTWAIENSKSGNADTKTLDKLASVLGLSLDYLVRGQGKRPPPSAIRAAVEAARTEYAAAHPCSIPPEVA